MAASMVHLCTTDVIFITAMVQNGKHQQLYILGYFRMLRCRIHAETTTLKASDGFYVCETLKLEDMLVSVGRNAQGQ